MHGSMADNIHEILGRSAKWGRNGGGAKSVLDACLVCRQYQTTFRQLCNGRFSPNLATTRETRKETYEKFPFRGHLLLKPKTLRGSHRYLTQSRLQVKGYTAESCSSRAREFLYDVRLRSYGASNLPNFRIFAYFPKYNTRNKYLPVTSLQPRDYIAE